VRRLPNKTETPPGGWRYTVPETSKTVGPYSGITQLLENLKGHYHAAAYEQPGNLPELIEKQICDENPEYCGEEGVPSMTQRFLKETKHTFHAALRCLATLVSHRAGSGERPQLADQERRALTCVACPKNQPIQQCSTCNNKSLNNLIEKIAGAKKTSVDAQLQYCEVCHCGLRAKIATMHSAIWTHMPENQKKQLPESCWIILEAKEKGNL
jgi:hypothetical protein